MKTLYVFRHGETDWNRETRFQGSTDIPLNETGRTQALALRDFFRQNPVEVFFSSDLIRAQQTAEIARGDAKVPIILDARLRETNLGRAEGLTHDEVYRQFGDLAKSWSSIKKDDWHVSFPEGETKLQHVSRLMEGLKDLLTRHSYERVAISSHGGSIRRLIHFIRPELTEPVMIGNCVLYEMHFDVETGLYIRDLSPKC